MSRLEYHKIMRRFLLILMLLSLPLRGLMGDAMAYSMLPTELKKSVVSSKITTESIANYSIFTSENIEKNDATRSDNVAQSPCHSAAAASDDASAESYLCTTCQVCHLTVFLPLFPSLRVAHAGVSLPSQANVLWHSAEPRRIAKTPVV